MLRMHDKVLELKHDAIKQITFAEVWGLPRSDAQPLTCGEFQLRRPILKTIELDEIAVNLCNTPRAPLRKGLKQLKTVSGGNMKNDALQVSCGSILFVGR